jgi:hypothetical protein
MTHEFMKHKGRMWLVEKREPVYRLGKHHHDAGTLRRVNLSPDKQTFTQGTSVIRVRLVKRTPKKPVDNGYGKRRSQ